jgi:hypothetical protein
VQEEDGGDGFGEGGGLVDFEADGFAAGEEGFGHGDWMRVEWKAPSGLVESVPKLGIGIENFNAEGAEVTLRAPSKA